MKFTEPSSSPDACACGHQSQVMPESTSKVGAHQRFRIANMDCASEETEIRHALSGVEGIEGLRFHLGERVLEIAAARPALDAALAAISSAGFKPEALSSTAIQSASSAEYLVPWVKPIVALSLALAAEGFGYFSGGQDWLTAVTVSLSALAIGLSGFSVYGKGLTALRRGHLNINALMTVAVTGAFLIGQWPEAAMVMALYVIAEAIEAKAVDRARNAIQSLLAMTPEQARVKQSDGTWIQRDVREIAVGATVRISPGERVPLDGVVNQGHSSVDQSPVTGESLPVDKSPSDLVFAGTLNQQGTLEVAVTAPSSGSTLARIIEAVERAQASRAPTQKFVDRFAAVYTPAVFVLAAAVALLAPVIVDWTWAQALYKALVLLVIACPCALVISTPVTIVSGLAAAARRGILIKGGTYLEDARKIRAFALDKTGTLTQGKPILVAFEALVQEVDLPMLKSVAHSLAGCSDHPVSHAIAAGLPVPAQEVTGFEALAGRGVRGRIGPNEFVLANHRWIEERQQCSAALEIRLKEHEAAGRSVTLLAAQDRVLAICAVADTLKPTSVQAVAELKALGITPVMLSGDNETTARSVGKQAGIDQVKGGLLPEEKHQAIEALQSLYGPTAMVGDGINDAPALAKADLGFAMGAAGTHTAIEAADVVVMNDDLRRLPETIRLSRRTHSVLWQNIGLALGIKLVFLVLALLGSATMWMAVFADMGASLLVVANGLRLLRAPVQR